ncbi:MAG: chromosome segregation protein SMC [Oscillospiraceae bacterium]|nr:chromosome segregation protein SMC [Oscillospiraceae bacterium]MDD4413267.1 chromosome segregation protein SMC [Oscillospiraceae bacterium]
MFLKSLEMQGFKSFPDKTVLSFGEGLTAVVGPNGSGKSNISDAIRWVLGEQSSKSLRGSKMEDVIFNGTEQRRGVGFSEVSLVIDNSGRRLDFDSDEVKVTRRYYRSGESEYLLNNATVRLKDVQMLFMDTGLGRDGYSIIGQGRISDIVSSKSDERREIFEEAAGIARFRYRKNEAERRLAAADDNLLRLRDILQELEDRIGPLEQQAEKAKNFLEYAQEKRDLEIGLWLHTLESSRENMREINSKLELARTQYDGASDKIDEIEAEIDQLAHTAQLLTVQMDEVRRSSQSLGDQAAGCDSEAAVLRNDIFHNDENIARIRGEIEQSHAGDKEFEEDIRRRMEDIENKKALIAQAQLKQQEIAEEMEGLSRSSDEFTGKMETLSEKASKYAMQLADIRVKTVTNESSLSEITLRLSQLAEGVALKTQQGAAARAEAAECETAYKACCDKAEELQNAVKGYEMRWQSRLSKLEAAKQKADKLGLDAEEKRRRVGLLEEMERSMEGFTQSVKTIMKQSERGMLRGIHGPITRLIDTPADMALAIETALGAATQNIICDTEDNAKRAIAYLKENSAGRATFLPLSSVKSRQLNEQGLDKENGYVGIASELVTCDKVYIDVVRSLLGRTVVAQDLDCAVTIARRSGYRFRVVTLDGQVVNAGGSMTGGSVVKSAGLLSRRAEIERIQADAQRLASEAEKAREISKQAASDAAASQAELTGTRGELATVQEDRIRLEGELKRVNEQAEANERAVSEFNAEKEKLNIRANECKRLAGEAEQEGKKIESEKAEIEFELGKLTGGRQELSFKREELSSRLSEIKLSILAYNKEIEAQTSALEALNARKQDAESRVGILEAEIVALEQKGAEIDTRIAEYNKKAEELRARAAETIQQIEEMVARRTDGEKRQTELRQLMREKSEERERTGREAARLEEKSQGVERETDEVVRRLYEEYELTRTEAEAIAKPIEKISKATRRLGELKSRIRGLGTVNVDAIEEFKEVSERYRFLSGQINDIEVSRTELRKLIAELTTQMRDVFIDKFKQINYHYGIVFKELFGGGKAELELTEPNDILNSGIEMHVQPPGKVILNMDALSGGEKALVAICLFFAILKVSPSPFCVLDEIEAALDDVNVDRYAAYLRRMTENTQFILITHRRGTMEEADVLYGVTMQERGVSKLLELRASEVEAKLGLKVDKD